jgi:hypothetical protein
MAKKMPAKPIKKAPVKKTVKKPIEKVIEPMPIPEPEPIQDENIKEQTAEVVEVIHGICKLPHHNDDGTVNWDMVNDCVDIMAQRKPGIENLEGHDQQSISRHLLQHFKEADLPIPDQIAALA